MKKKLSLILIFIFLFSLVCAPANAEDFEAKPKPFEEINSDSGSFTAELSKYSFVYNGKVQTPAVAVKDKNKNAVPAKNYTVSYSSGRKNVGAYYVKITFKNGAPAITKSFTIIPKATSITKLKGVKKGFKLKWKKQKAQVSGYEIQYSLNKYFSKNTVKTVKIKTAKKNKKTIKKLKSNKNYYVRIRTYKTVNKKTYYSSYSKTQIIKTK